MTTKMTKAVFCITRFGRYYTGNAPGGNPEFVEAKDAAIELDAEEAQQEMQSMPPGAIVETLYTFTVTR